MKNKLNTYISLISLSFFILNSCKPIAAEESLDEASIIEMYESYHDEAFAFVKANQLNTAFYFLIDFNIHSGKPRFFIYNFEDKKISHQALSTHGSCDVFEPNPEKYKKVKFSNKPDSHCSSIGKYRIGNRDYSSWGIKIKYWLHGLETTNNKAVPRVVVLHSWEAVSDETIYPRYSPLSWGCPAVSNAFMKTLDEMLQKANPKPLLWIIDHSDTSQ